MKAKIDSLIKRWNIELAYKNGQEGLAVRGKPSAAEVAELKELKSEIMAELKRRAAERRAAEKAKKAAEEAARQEEIRAMKAGELKITLHYHDGEYLSGYEVFGAAADLLEELGLAEYVDGWGYHVADAAVKALGKEFTYSQAVEYTRPAREAAEAQKAAAEKKAAEKEARRASMKVEILEKGNFGKGEDSEVYANVEITDPATGESAKFACRNVFDVGYVINPLYAVSEGVKPGGVAVRGHWETFRDDENFTGWITARPLTPFEKKALDYLREFPPVYAGIRM